MSHQCNKFAMIISSRVSSHRKTYLQAFYAVDSALMVIAECRYAPLPHTLYAYVTRGSVLPYSWTTLVRRPIVSYSPP